VRRLGWGIQEALNAPLDQVQESVVDCGTCPVNILCLAGRGGTGLKFRCCGVTVVLVTGLDGADVRLMVDCTNHQFEDGGRALEFELCPLCSHGAVESELLWPHKNARWLPTVHAKHSVALRLASCRAALPDIRKRIARDAEIGERGRVKP
jgi:hypothetical protein